MAATIPAAVRVTSTAAEEATRAKPRLRLDPWAIPLLAVVAALSLLLGALAGLLLAGAVWVSAQVWKIPLPAWLRAVLVSFTALAAVLLYLIGTAILALLLRS